MTPEFSTPTGMSLHDIKVLAIREALRRSRGDRLAASRELRVSRQMVMMYIASEEALSGFRTDKNEKPAPTQVA